MEFYDKEFVIKSIFFKFLNNFFLYHAWMGRLNLHKNDEIRQDYIAFYGIIVRFNWLSSCQLRAYYTTFRHFLQLVHECGLGTIETSFAIDWSRGWCIKMRYTRVFCTSAEGDVTLFITALCCGKDPLLQSSGNVSTRVVHSAGEWHGSLRLRESRKKNKIQSVNRTVNV